MTTNKRREPTQFYEDDDSSEYTAQFEDEDSVSRLIEYTKQHNAILHYYYKDNSNKVQVCEIFDIQRPRRQSPGYFSQLSLPATRTRKMMSKDPSQVLKEEEDIEPDDFTSIANPIPSTSSSLSMRVRHPTEYAYADKLSEPTKENEAGQEPEDFRLGQGTNKRGDDSGVNSLAEESVAARPVSKKRDACCSPVRQFGTNSTSGMHPKSSLPARNSGASSSSAQVKHFGAVRRHTTLGVSTRNISSASSAPSIRKHVSSFLSSKTSLGGTSSSNRNKMAPGPFSSDSDADVGDELFVANRRKRTTSNEYDGEPEPSDTDPGRRPAR